MWILFLNADGSVRARRSIPVEGQPPISVAAVRDLDGDEVTELALGRSGSVDVLFLTPTGSVKASTEIAEGIGGFDGDLEPTDGFGWALASRGDLDGDGLPDLAVGAPNSDDRRGAVWLLFLDEGGTVRSEVEIGWQQGGFGGTIFQNGDEFGSSVAFLGQFDGAGYDDLVVGAPFTWGCCTGTDGQGAIWTLLLGEVCPGLPCTSVGTRFCDAAVPNSTGEVGSLFVQGSPIVAEDDLRLLAAPLPFEPNIGYFLMGTGSSTFVPPGSAGPICVAPGIRRYLDPIENTTELRDVYGPFYGGFRRVIGTSGPVSSEIRDALARSLRAKGYTVTTVNIDPREAVTDARRRLTSGGTKAVMITLHEWKSDTMMNTDIHYDVSLSVIGARGEELAANSVKGLDNIGNAGFSPGPTISAALGRKLEMLFDHERIVSALK